VHDPAAVRALIAALDDCDALVRHHAARGLLASHGMPASAEDKDHMLYRVMAEGEGGKRDILAAITARPVAAT
jgi:hypothetical protein